MSESERNIETSKKPLSFWLSFVALNITVFIVSLDSTALAVAVPVCSSEYVAYAQEIFADRSAIYRG